MLYEAVTVFLGYVGGKDGIRAQPATGEMTPHQHVQTTEQPHHEHAATQSQRPPR